jgi:hypothetical protein
MDSGNRIPMLLSQICGIGKVTGYLIFDFQLHNVCNGNNFSTNS